MKQIITANKTARAITVIGYCLLVIVLSSCSGDGSQMRAQLEELERQNRADSVMTNDSLAEQLVKYFDRHGTPNERMRAHYILGRTYADMGEAPQALEEYHTAIECADTTANDCNYHLLTRIHAQSVSLFYEQLMPNEMLNELDYMNACAHHANDTLSWIITLEWKSVAYDLLRDKDNVKKYILDAYDEYILYGDSAMAADCLPLYIDLLIKDKDYCQAKQYLDYFEKNSSFFVDNKIAQGKEIYYYSKGNYYLGVNQLDSAGYYYRDAICSTMNIDATEAGYKGLYELFMLKGDADSVAKYANLCYQTSEKRFQDSNTRQLSRMQSLYNYNRYQKLAHEKSEESLRRYYMLLLFLILFMIIAVLSVVTFRRYKRRKKEELLSIIQGYQQKIEQQERAKNDLLQLKRNETEALIAQKELEIIARQKQIDQYHQIINQEIPLESTFIETAEYKRFHYLCSHPREKVTKKDWHDLQKMMDCCLPLFYKRMNARRHLKEVDYQICMLIRLHFAYSEISMLTNTTPQYVYSRRVQLLKTVFDIKGKAEEFDKMIWHIQ